MPRAIATLGMRLRIELLLAGLRRYEVTFADPHGDLTGTRDLLLLVEEPLLPLGKPARRPPDGEEHREHLDREAHGLVDDPGVEVHVWVQLVGDEVLVLQGQDRKSTRLNSSHVKIS